MFDDVVHSFRGFFQPTKYSENKLLELMCYALTHRHYSLASNTDEPVIYDETDEVLEIIFIQKGEVGVGFKLQNALSAKRYELTTVLGTHSYFADYYVLCNVKAQFCYVVTKPVHALALSKRFLLH